MFRHGTQITPFIMTATTDRILTQIRAAGVVGAGGAGFPTYKKLDAQVEHVPAVAEEDEVDVGGADRSRGCGQDGEDRRIRVVEENRADRRERFQVVLAGSVVAVPGDHVERGLADLALVKAAANLLQPLHHA